MTDIATPRFTTALIQMAMSADPAANLRTAEARIREAATAGAQVLCLPELFRSLYFCQREDPRFFDLAEPVPGPTTEAMSALARELGVVLVVPLFERRAPGLCHNSLAVFDADGRCCGLYRKMHIPDDPGYYEKYYFTPGDLGVRVFDTRFGRIGALICWDQWYPEAARLAALRGAEILFYPTAIGWHPSEKARYGFTQHDAWETIQRSHAIANGCYVCAPNRIGHERILGADGKPVNRDGIEFWGQSFVCGPDGQVISRASADREEIVTADCNLSRVEAHRTHWPFLRDRRVDAYGDLVRRFSDDER